MKTLSEYISMVSEQCEEAQIKPSDESILAAAVQLMLVVTLDKIAYGTVHHPGAIENISMEIKNGFNAVAQSFETN